MLEFNRQLGEWLRSNREAAGISVQEAALKIECPPSQIEAFEAGEAAVPSPDMIKLSRLYGVTPSETMKFIFSIQHLIKN